MPEAVSDDLQPRRSRARTALVWGLSIVSTVVMLWVARERFAVEMWPVHFTIVRPDLLVFAALVHLPYATVRAGRLRWVLDDLVSAAGGGPRLDRRVLYGSGFVSSLILLLMPLKLGELSRPILLASERQPGVTGAAALGAVGLERVLDGLLICAMLFGGLALVEHGDGSRLAVVHRFGHGMGLAFILAFVAALVAARDPAAWGARARGWFALLGVSAADTLGGFVVRVATSFRVLYDARRLAPMIASSILYWAITTFQLALVAGACGLELGPAAATATVAIIGLSIQLPGGPAQAGTFQVGAGAALSLLCDPDSYARGGATFVATMFGLQLVGAIVMAVPGAWLLASARARRKAGPGTPGPGA